MIKFTLTLLVITFLMLSFLITKEKVKPKYNLTNIRTGEKYICKKFRVIYSMNYGFDCITETNKFKVVVSFRG